MNVIDLFPYAQFNDRVHAGYVTARDHPDLPLTILNYTAKAQYERMWDEVTTVCRGLIIDSFTGEIISRPFPKFFNLGEHDEADLPSIAPHFVHDKLDGSLGIAYEYDGHIGIATRGSFESEQAVWATEWLLANHPTWTPDHGVTYLFEIIYPDNRIVVNYGDRAELVLLATLDTEAGHDMIVKGWPGAVAERFDIEDMELLAKAVNERDNCEGFVCTWWQPEGPSVRIKLKADEYVRLHRVVTGLSNRTVWEHLAAGSVEQLRDDTPDEFYEWFDEQVDALLSQHRDIVECAQTQLDTITQALPGANRKLLAEAIQQSTTYPGLCFALLDGKDISERVWRMVKPERETALVSETEDA